MKKQVALLGLMLFAIVFTGCSRVDSEQTAAKKPPPGSVLLRGAGATFPSLLYEKWFAQYQQLHPEVFITYDAVGSGAGVERFIGVGAEAEKQVEFGASDTAMSDAEMVKVPRGVRLIPMTASGIALAYNIPGLRGELKLSREAYTGIFLGKIRNWNDPVIRRCNPDLQLPKMTIAVVTRRDSSGTTFAFTKHLDAVSPEWSRKYGAANFVDFPCGPMRAKGNEGVAMLIEHSAGSIGYVGLGFAQKLGLKAAALENRAGRYVEPTYESAMAAMASAELPENLRLFLPDPEGEDSYPIVTLSWILLYQDYDYPEKAEAVKGLFGWCLEAGQTFSRDLGYVPLAPKMVNQASAALKTIRP
ncbi:MAG: phosphate ABC transporter substrate-binding protein PstS [Syntrophobacteraceae bacterium]|jgi:phosphate transport system substrate-binding protein